ncbi:putative glutathione S-transferase [Mycena albidolilacea]|uniref:Glutathione S-transferase n=1 Tax=Mycena albidolilacea TaxID=1033008 RepID=A0AAD7ED85_9AGAR|nr:putative glutathione S-transferase [Mycena albidolilacea]
MPTLIVHHLHVSQSERIPWLCEELAIPYELKTYKRAPILAPPEYKALHASGSAPVIQDGDLTLAESGACVEYISHRHAGGALFLPPTHADYPHFLYWWHWSNSTFQPAVAALMAGQGLEDDNPRKVALKDRVRRALVVLDKRLEMNQWLAGEEFTVADVMIVFTLTTMRYFYPYSLGEYASVVKYLQRVGAREAYQRAMKKCEPELELVLGADPPRKLFGGLIRSKY